MPYKVDFKQIATDVDIADVAAFAGLHVGRDNYADCPACESKHAIRLYRETNSYQCFASGDKRNSDCIALYAHVTGTGMYKAAVTLQERFLGAARTAQATAPQKTEGGTAQVAQPAPPSRKERQESFDPVAFASKLQYTDEVQALGFTQEDAERFGIGFHRGRVYIPVRDPDGSVAGFIGYADGQFKLPKWLPPQSNVVRFPKSA